MSFLDSLKLTLSRFAGNGAVVSNTYPSWETSTPQYTTPTAYNLANIGYRRNELVFACIDELATSVSEPPMVVYDDRNPKTRKALDDHPLTVLLDAPNPYMTGPEFQRIKEVYVNIAGFSAWEIEVNNLNQPIALWPMRPDYCAFLRGNQMPLRAIRYSVPGLAFEDIPIERVLLFQEFDPLYPKLKGLSRTAVAMRVTEVDNGMTDFLKLFFQNGALVQGTLKTEQSLTEPEAERIRTRWQKQYGGPRNWTTPAVLGQGVEYTRTGQTFREMMADELDARDEARICMVFRVSPILISAKLGMGTITENNYKEARAAMYERVIQPKWMNDAAIISRKLLPMFEGAESKSWCGYDTTDVKALQEDRTAKWTRAVGAFEKNLVTRDEARAEMQMDPIDNEDVFYGDTVQAVRETLQGNPGAQPGAEISDTTGEQPSTPQDAVAQAEQVAADAQAKQDEARRAKSFFKKRAKEGKPAAWDDFKWLRHTPAEAKSIAGADTSIEARIEAALERFDKAMQA